MSASSRSARLHGSAALVGSTRRAVRGDRSRGVSVATRVSGSGPRGQIALQLVTEGTIHAGRVPGVAVASLGAPRGVRTLLETPVRRTLRHLTPRL